MSRHEERFGMGRAACGRRIVAEIAPGGDDGALSRLAAQVRPRPAEQSTIVGVRVRTPTIGGENGADLAQRRDGDDDAVVVRGTRKGLLAHEQVLLNIPDQQQDVPCRDWECGVSQVAVSAAAITWR